MADCVSTLNKSVIQHGRDNDRIYLMKLGGDVLETIEHLDSLAAEHGYSKIIAKVPEAAQEAFEQHGYIMEAMIPRFYNGSTDAYFMAKFIDPERGVEKNEDKIFDVLSAANTKSRDILTCELPEGYTYAVADESQAEEISSVYRQVFESYPFPILDAGYVLQTMKENVIYFCVMHGDKIVSVASSEMDKEAENVEMTDFATLPDHLSHGFAVFLLKKMEEVMKMMGMKTAYTIARAASFGMNITFAKMGYEYVGTLTNNTDICGNLESMNIWFKPLCPVSDPREE